MCKRACRLLWNICTWVTASCQWSIVSHLVLPRGLLGSLCCIYRYQSFCNLKNAFIIGVSDIAISANFGMFKILCYESLSVAILVSPVPLRLWGPVTLAGASSRNVNTSQVRCSPIFILQPPFCSEYAGQLWSTLAYTITDVKSCSFGSAASDI